MREFCFLLLTFLLLPSCSQETKEEESVIGYMGRARKNPYLAAELYLEADGKEVLSSNGVLKLNAASGTVFAPASSVRSEGDAERVLEWVADGGHFVCFLERGEDYWRDVGNSTDHTADAWSESDEDDTANGMKTILAALELDLVIVHPEVAEDGNEGVSDSTDEEKEDAEGKARRTRIAKGEELPAADEASIYINDSVSLDVLLGGSRQILAEDEVYYEGDWYDTGDQHRFFSRLYGYSEYEDAMMGRVTLISEARLFRNPYLQSAQHAELLDTLVAGDGEVEFSLGKVRSFTAMLGEYAPKALWGLLVLTIVWLWKNLPRFGPLLDVAEGHSRKYLEHVLQVGRFYWQQNRPDILVESLRTAVIRKSGHAFSEQQCSEALIEKLSESTELDYDTIQEAMQLSEVKDSSTIVRITKNLQTILKQL